MLGKIRDDKAGVLARADVIEGSRQHNLQRLDLAPIVTKGLGSYFARGVGTAGPEGLRLGDWHQLRIDPAVHIAGTDKEQPPGEANRF